MGLVHALLYAAITPPWQGPDEPRHFEYMAQMARGITPAEPAALTLQGEIIASMTAERFWDYGYSITPYDPASPPQTLDDIWPGFAHQTHQPPLYYWLSSFIVRAAGRLPLADQLRWVRVFSALLCAGVVWLTWATARTLLPAQPRWAGAIALCVALQPMHTFAYATANNDNLAAFFVCVQVWLAARALRHGLRLGETLLQAGLVILALVTKRTGFIAPVLLLLTLIAAAWPALTRLWHGRRGRRGLLAAAGALVALCAGGVVLLVAARPLVSRLWGGFFHLPKDVLELLFSGSYAQALLKTPYPYYTRVVFESFWARFGWLNVPLTDAWYIALAGVSGLAGLGLVLLGIRVWRGRLTLQPYQGRVLIVFVCISILAYVLIIAKEVLYLSYLIGVTPQGRYLFPVIIPLATLLVIGLAQWTPAARRRLAGYLGVAALVAFDLICIVAYILPHYRS
jgi:hypothetical protein